MPSRRGPNHRHANDTFLDPVDTYDRVYLLVIQGANLAVAAIETRSRQSEVLGDVAHIEVDVSVSPLAVLPFAAFKHRRPYEDHRGRRTHSLIQSRYGDLPTKIPLPQLFELMRPDRVMVDAGFDSFDVIDYQIGLYRVQSPG